MRIGVATVENSMEVPPETKKKQLPYDPAISPLGIHLNKMKTLTGKNTQV